MKKRLILGDMHGRFDIIKEIYDIEQPQDVIMLGDYLDSHEVNTDNIHDSFINICNLRDNHIKNNIGNFIMLLGNHDYHYIMNGESYSGYNWRTESWANTLIREKINNKDIQIIYIDEINKTIYSHAGISNSFLKETCSRTISSPDGVTIYDINTLPLNYFVFERNFDYSMYGDTKWNGPLWIRPKSLVSDIYTDDNNEVWTQIVGHTMVKKATWIDTNDEKTNNKILLLDAIHVKNYLVETIDENNIIINRKIKSL